MLSATSHLATQTSSVCNYRRHFNGLLLIHARTRRASFMIHNNSTYSNLNLCFFKPYLMCISMKILRFALRYRNYFVFAVPFKKENTDCWVSNKSLYYFKFKYINIKPLCKSCKTCTYRGYNILNPEHNPLGHKTLI